jgi:predicted RNase H-like HicB family nuclease
MESENMAQLIAVVHGYDGVYGVSYPDFPGLASGGVTIDEAISRSRDGLQSLIEDMIEDGKELPMPRGFDAIRSDPALAEDLTDMVAFAVVEFELPNKSVRLNITMDEGLVSRIDRAAKAVGETRSGFLAHAAKARLMAG